MTEPKTFTGRTRRRTTKWTVRVKDRVARSVIAVGGIGTIAAVLAVCVFLVSVVIPLGQLSSPSEARPLANSKGSARVLHMACDEYRQAGCALCDDGIVRVFRLDDGKALGEQPVAAGENPPKLTASAFAVNGEQGVFGFADGSVRLGALRFSSTFLRFDQAPQNLRDLAIGELVAYEGGLATRVTLDRFRLQTFQIDLENPIPAKTPSPIALIDHVRRNNLQVYAALSADGTLSVNSVTKRLNILTDETILSVTTGIAPPLSPRASAPKFLFVSGTGNDVFLAWEDGHLVRYDASDTDKIKIVEEIDLVPQHDAQLTAAQFLLGDTTLLVGDSRGRVRTWFTAHFKADDGVEHTHLVNASEFSGPDAAVTALAVCPLWRLFAAGYADGSARLCYVTSQSTLATFDSDRRGAVRSLMLAPNGDALVTSTDAGMTRWDLEIKHPEATPATLFTKVRYEGAPHATHDWQSTGGTDDFEKKLGLMPLVFGTFKATFFSILFGAPLALLAAIYTSEFLHPRTKARVKPVIETMASLPSVVLGFLTVVVVAKFVQGAVVQTLMCVWTVPWAFGLGAYLWQLLPRTWAMRVGRGKLFAIAAMLPVGIGLGSILGPIVEQQFFLGDFQRWLGATDRPGNGVGGWLFLFLPLAMLLVVWSNATYLQPTYRRWTASWPTFQVALCDLIRFVLLTAVTCLLAWLAGVLLDAVALKPRGSGLFYFFDTYQQRNALILGGMMGFAIIPIIYTVAEDALSSVPQHLRSASLGAGATPWQTAVRIIIPTAMSGLFSALMIGIGRAAGETMILLMAAGKTPIFDMNMFNGMATLSAVIATELSEAAEGSTHYRVLYLAALTLFAMTFVLNSVAEAVRLRFRRRAHEL